jgi:hypothetical protein
MPDAVGAVSAPREDLPLDWRPMPSTLLKPLPGCDVSDVRSLIDQTIDESQRLELAGAPSRAEREPGRAADVTTRSHS